MESVLELYGQKYHQIKKNKIIRACSMLHKGNKYIEEFGK
jgi:hypothetical protein